MAKNATIGVLFDGDMGPGRSLMVDATAAGIAASAFTGEVKILSAEPDGLPHGSEHGFRKGFRDLAEAGVLAIIGPGLSENGFIARDMAEEYALPTVIWAAHQGLRSQWSFHFQLGSLEEEQAVLLGHLAARGIRRAALVYDDINIILQYVDFLESARRIYDIEIVARTAMVPEIEDASEAIAAVMSPRAEALIYLGMGPSSLPVALAKKAAGWDVPVVSCSSLLMGRSRADIAEACEGWVYCDMVSETNPRYLAATGVLPPAVARSPVGPCFYDMGRLVGEALDRALYRTRASLRDGFERIKQLPATVGHPGTHMTVGNWDRAILKGPFLVLRTYRGGQSVAVS